jgi:hypothetical protein
MFYRNAADSEDEDVDDRQIKVNYGQCTVLKNDYVNDPFEITTTFKHIFY